MPFDHMQGANKTDKVIERIGRAIGTLAAVLKNFDTNNDVAVTSGRRRQPDDQIDIQVVVKELLHCKAFKVEAGRKYKPFPNL